MANQTDGQDLFAYFQREGKWDYQRAIQMLRTVSGVLPETTEHLLHFLVDASYRFGRDFARIKPNEFVDGKPASDGFGGLCGLPAHSEKTRYKAFALLERIGVLKRDGQVYSVDITRINAADFLCDEEIRRGFMGRNRHNPNLRTEQGVAKWASQRLLQTLTMMNGIVFSQDGGNSKHSASVGQLTDRIYQNLQQRWQTTQIAPASSSQEKTSRFARFKTRTISSDGRQTKTNSSGSFPSLILWSLLDNNDLPYSFLSIIDIISSNKLDDNWGSILLGKCMANRSADRVKSDVLKSTSTAADKVRDRRRTRRSPSDRLALFEQQWMQGQRDAGVEGVPSRIVRRQDRRLIKEQIIKAASPDFDTDDFAHWTSMHWDQIGQHYFQYSKKYPSQPTVPWLIACLETYMEAYRNRDMIDFDLAETGVGQRAQITAKVRQADAAEKTLQSTAQELAVAKAEARELRRELREAQQNKDSKGSSKSRKKSVGGKINFDERW